MSDQPFISIIIVCYNYGHLLPRALEAISRQEFRDFEIVFVDNGCTDNSLDVMRAFATNHPEISVVYFNIEKNIGIAYGENKGVDAATGKYLMFHDADDWMDDDALQLLADAAQSEDADRVIAAFRNVDDNGNVLQTQELGKEPNYWLYTLHHANLFRTSLYKECGIHVCISGLTDVERTFQFSSVTKRAAYVFKPCYNWFVSKNSTSRRVSSDMSLLTEHINSLIKLISLCQLWLPPKDDADHSIAVYQMARVYYGNIFADLRYAPLKDTYRLYDHLHDAMLEMFPDYMECVATAKKYKKTVRPFGYWIPFLAFTLERLHLMKLGLIFYHLLSKFIYFIE